MVYIQVLVEYPRPGSATLPSPRPFFTNAIYFLVFRWLYMFPIISNFDVFYFNISNKSQKKIGFF